MDCKLAGLLLALTVAGCATATPYQPLRDDGGYSDQKIESNRFRIRFVGNASTARETVETYLLYRAAEVTLDHGYDYFVLADQHTQAHNTYYQSFGFGGGWGRYYWGPRFGIDTLHTDTEYEGRITVVMFKGKKKEAEIKAFDAHEVRTNLAAEIVRPEVKD